MTKIVNFFSFKCPDSVYYIPDFLTVDEEQLLLKNVYNVPQTKWIQLSKRRLQNWGGVPHPNGMVQETIPQVKLYLLLLLQTIFLIANFFHNI